MNVSLRSVIFWLLLIANLGCSSPDPAVKAYLDGVVEINNEINKQIELSGYTSHKRLQENRGKSAELQAKALTADRDQWAQERLDLESKKARIQALKVPETGTELQEEFLAFIEAYDQRLQSKIKAAETQLVDGQPPSREDISRFAAENQALVDKYNVFDKALKGLGKRSGIAVN